MLNVSTVSLVQDSSYSNCCNCGEDNYTKTASTFSSAILTWMIAATFFFSTLFNVMACVVYASWRGQLSTSNLFLVNLTVCDLLLTLLASPTAFLFLVTHGRFFGAVVCQVLGFVINTSLTLTTFTLTLIAMDRYCAVLTPLHYAKRITRRVCALVITGTWILSLLISVPFTLVGNGFRFRADRMLCSVDWSNSDRAHRYYTAIFILVSFLIPMNVIFWTYGCMFKAAWSNCKRILRSSVVSVKEPWVKADCLSSKLCKADSQLASRKRKMSSSLLVARRRNHCLSRTPSFLKRRVEWKTATTSFLILFSFLLCWLPYFAVISVQVAMPTSHVHPIITKVTILGVMLGSGTNPIVYIFRSTEVQRGLRRILKRLFQR